MVLEFKLRKVGNSAGVVLPKEALARLTIQEGDTITLTDTPEGGVRVTPATAGREEFAKQDEGRRERHSPLPQHFARSGQVDSGL